MEKLTIEKFNEIMEKEESSKEYEGIFEDIKIFGELLNCPAYLYSILLGIEDISENDAQNLLIYARYSRSDEVKELYDSFFKILNED